MSGERDPRIVETPVSALRPWPENPRTIAPERLEALKRAMTADAEMLWARPLIALPDGTVICGNQRLLAARELAWTTIPTFTIDLDWEHAWLWALRDNNQYGVWEEDALADLLRELEGGGVDLALAGFESRDLDRLLATFKPETDPDEAPPLPDRPDSTPGTVYELGEHRLLCGDATDTAQLRQMMDGALADVLWTDPPYGVEYVGKTRDALRIRNDTSGDLTALLRDAFASADRVLTPSARFYIAAPAGPLGLTFRNAILEQGWLLRQALVWVKQTLVLGHADYHYQHEDILYGHTPGPGRPGRGRHRGSRWYGDNRQTTVFQIDRPTRSAEHPTMKPVALIEAMLLNSSKRGDIVLDPFAGSGSTLIACERLGRRCIAVELDPRYCDVIRTRYREYADA